MTSQEFKPAGKKLRRVFLEQHKLLGCVGEVQIRRMEQYLHMIFRSSGFNSLDFRTAAQALLPLHIDKGELL